MRIENQKLTNCTLNYPLERIAPLHNILFLDIETTGFSAETSQLYLIGCAYYEDGHWNVMQWLADTFEEEKDILAAFFQFSARFSHLIHFNGNNFDLPFLSHKCSQYRLPYSFERFEGIDMYRRIAPYKSFLKLPNCKLRTIEAFLDIKRSDTYNGRDLISIYHDYIASPSIECRYLLLLHNSDDMKGMLAAIPILAYCDLFSDAVKAKKVQANYYTDLNGKGKHSLLMKLVLPAPLPVAVSASVHGCYFKGEGREGTLSVPLFEEELKYFYANYKDYYYLPTEDSALHKSIAAYVDKEFRKPATAATCYTKKKATYLPQWGIVIEPFFKREYNSAEFFFEVTDEIKKDRNLFTKYTNHILQMIAAQA